jgi:hypothetical protein
MSATVRPPRPNTLRVPLPARLFSSSSKAHNVFRHIFCQRCITRALQSSQLCPIDRSPLPTEDLKPAPKIVASLVNELLVQCPRSCGAKVERGCLPGHVKGNCDLEEIPCVCGIGVSKRDLKTVIEVENLQGDETAVVPCVHEWLACPDCPARFERQHRKVYNPPLFTLFR